MSSIAEGRAGHLHISNFFGTRNKGDEAMLRGLIAFLNADGRQRPITVSAFFRDPDGERALPDITFVDSLGTRDNLFDALATAILFMLLYLGWRRPFAWLLPLLRPSARAAVESIREAGAVYVTGGPFFKESYTRLFGMRLARFNLVRPLIELYVARLYGKKLYILGQTFGAFDHSTSRVLLRPIFRHAALVSCRESSSRDAVAHWPELQGKLVAHPDLAFGTVGQWPAGGPREPMVAVNVRHMTTSDLHFLFAGTAGSASDAQLQARYAAVVAEALGLIAETSPDVRFLFLNQAMDNDRHAAQDVIAKLAIDAARIAIQPEGTSIAGMIAAIQSAQFVLSTRYHSTIFSIIGATPFQAFSYGRKIEKALVDYGLAGHGVRGTAFTAGAIHAAYVARSGANLTGVASRLHDALFDCLRREGVQPPV